MFVVKKRKKIQNQQLVPLLLLPLTSLEVGVKTGGPVDVT